MTQPLACPKKQSKEGTTGDPTWVPIVCSQGTGMEGRCDLSTPALEPRAGIPTGLTCSAAQDHLAFLLFCIFGSGCSHTSLGAFTPGTPAQGSTCQGSALGTIFSPSPKLQSFLAPGACLLAGPHGMAILLQSPGSGLQSWL